MKDTPKAREGYTILPNSSWTDLKGLSFAGKLLWMLLLSYQKDGWAWPSQTRLAKELDCSRSYLNEIINELIESGHITRAPGRKGKNTRYKIKQTCKNIQVSAIPDYPAKEGPAPEQASSEDPQASSPLYPTTVINSGSPTYRTGVSAIPDTTITNTSTNKTITTSKSQKPDPKRHLSWALNGYARDATCVNRLWRDFYKQYMDREYLNLTQGEATKLKDLWGLSMRRCEMDVEKAIRLVRKICYQAWHHRSDRLFPYKIETRIPQPTDLITYFNEWSELGEDGAARSGPEFQAVLAERREKYRIAIEKENAK